MNYPLILAAIAASTVALTLSFAGGWFLSRKRQEKKHEVECAFCVVIFKNNVWLTGTNKMLCAQISFLARKLHEEQKLSKGYRKQLANTLDSARLVHTPVLNGRN